jgi:pimeloyl-ACP methyl ester carboxylesterase
MPQPLRPQEPKPPFPYRSIEVRYDNPAAPGVTLVGTLTLPAGEDPFPAVLLISGSGQNERDVPFFGHRMFLVLADYLTRRGLAVLRYDDRGAGESTLGPKEFNELTTADFVADARAGVVFLRTRVDIDQKRVGLLGHSEGSLIAQIIAAESAEEIAFLVLLGVGNTTKGEILATQSEVMAHIEGYSAKAQKADREFVRRALVVTHDEAEYDKRRQLITKIADEALAKAPSPERAKIEPGIRTRVKILASENFHHDARQARRDYLRPVRCPVLALNGSKDVLVPAEMHIPRVRASLKAGGNADYTALELPGLNHMFQSARTGLMEEAEIIEETFAPTALHLIGDWMTERVTKQ